MKTIYVGGLPLSAKTEEVMALFSPFGDVDSVTLMKKDNGDPRGFGFVVMEDVEAMKAVDELDGVEFGGEILRINESRDRGAKAPRRAW